LFRHSIEDQVVNDTFVTKSFSYLNRKKRLDTHVGELTSFYNVVVKRCNDLLNPNRSIAIGLSNQSDRRFPKKQGEQNERIKKGVLRNVMKIIKMVSPKIQKGIANCFAEVNLFIYFTLFYFQRVKFHE
jgi:hypothetical protein